MKIKEKFKYLSTAIFVFWATKVMAQEITTLYGNFDDRRDVPIPIPKENNFFVDNLIYFIAGIIVVAAGACWLVYNKMVKRNVKKNNKNG